MQNKPLRLLMHSNESLKRGNDMSILEIAKTAEYNSKQEAQAIFDYTQMIKDIIECNELGEEDKNALIAKIKELTADELNHQNVLQEIYVSLTTIEPKID